MGSSISKSTPSITPVQGIKENATSKSQEKRIVPFNLSLAKMINKVKNKMESLPNDTEKLNAMVNELTEKSENIKLPEVLVKNKFGFYDPTLKKQRVDIIVNLLTVLSNINICFLKLFLVSDQLKNFIENGKVKHARQSYDVDVNGAYIKQYFTLVTSIIELSIEQMISDTNETRKQAFHEKRFYELDNDEIWRIIGKYSAIIMRPMSAIESDALKGLYYSIEKSNLSYTENRYQARELFAKEFNLDNIKDWVATEKYGPLIGTKFYRKYSRQSRSQSRNKTRKN